MDNHDVTVEMMIDREDDKDLGLSGRPAEQQFLRLARGFNDMKQRAEKAEAEFKSLSDKVWAYMLECFGDPDDFPQWVKDYARKGGK